MANEATLIYRMTNAVPMTVSNTVGIEKGAVLALIDPMTASGATTLAPSAAGIAASEKIASDGKTKLGVYRGGIFKVTLSGACAVGDSLVIEGTSLTNYVIRANPAVSGSKVIGTALETGATGETILMELNIGANGNA